MTELLLHRGSWEATKADLAAVAVPEETDSYVPVPYSRFVEEVEIHAPRLGLVIESSAFALARGGQQMFGVLNLQAPGSEGDYTLALGLRNSYDHSFSLGLVAGVRVFICDNLAFSGEFVLNRKHTANVFRDLPDLVYRLLAQVGPFRERQDREIALWKRHDLLPWMAHHLMIEAVQADAIPVSRLPHVIEAWEKPKHEAFEARNAWSLYNAFTEVQKSRSPRAQIEGNLRLTEVFRSALST
jgi:hypothetical protein